MIFNKYGYYQYFNLSIFTSTSTLPYRASTSTQKQILMEHSRHQHQQHLDTLRQEEQQKTLAPIALRNTTRQEEQQTNEPMDFISFAFWTQSQLLFVDSQPLSTVRFDDKVLDTCHRIWQQDKNNFNIRIAKYYWILNNKNQLVVRTRGTELFSV